ncbi:DNA-binding SARP family transcriptional activator [Streptosporangium becharense]|uniref:DNA-binding SARP family transcriptional activator n=1 Tax=Streptosporangium becharense TaxID=1816182 RepID=A0A7W9ME92_9ACTN|nr:BTAD domain-containing putative transcriptional regulator [Streptosporangium becharense]MBB2910860.1 DNA-binding SARP family transcriptional activator [Streptosporangium becharense]MBB5817555.1 DNA-binding SARP family transcriptional activator [Streptosporangium becharense]
MDFRVLGPFEVRDTGASIGLGGPRQRAVLARLVVAAGAVVSTDTLINDLYRGTPPATALASLHVYVSNLRRSLEPGRAPRTAPRLLVARRPGYRLATTDVDALQFGRLVSDAEQGPSLRTLALLDEALALWRGLPYGEFAGELWAVTEVNRLCELRLAAVERRARALLDLGRPQAVIHDLETEIGEHPLRERLWWLLTLALYRDGRQADALGALRRARRLIADQIGLDPGPDLRALEEDILRQNPSLAPPPEPVSVTSAARAATSLRAPTAEKKPSHGRDLQLAEMEAVLSRGTVNAIAVSGEPGIGKTWLLDAFRERCAESDHLVLWSGCQHFERTLPLRPWITVLKTLARVHPAPDRRALAGLLDEETPEGSTERARLRRHRAIAEWLAAAARTRPLVIIMDDLHWADQATLELIGDVVALIVEEGEDVPLTLVTAYRDSAQPSGIDALLNRCARHDLLRVRLDGLDPAAVREIAAGLGTEIDEATAHTLTHRTAGNPFFVRETIRALARGRPLNTVPDSVVHLIRQRLAAAGPHVSDVLQVAAVIGREFDADVVAEVRPGPVYDLLDQAVTSGLVVTVANRMAFAHDLVRETLLQEIPPLRKAIIHRDTMNVLATRPGVDVAVIAQHAIEAGPTAYGEAARWAAAMAEQASLRLAYREAATWWSRAVEAHGATAGDPADHVGLLLHQVHALLEAGDVLAARHVRGQAIRIAGRVDGRERPMLVARALTALNAPCIWNLRNPYEAVELRLVHRFELALRALPGDSGAERARLLGGLAQELYDGTDDPRCHTYSAEAVEIARRYEDPYLLMRLLNARYLSIPSAIYPRQVLRIAEELEDLALRTQTPEFELTACMMLTHRRLEEFDLARADEAAERCDAMLARTPLPWPRFQHTLWHAGRLVLAGRYDEAEDLYAEADRQTERIGMWCRNAVVPLGRILLQYQRGRITEAAALIDSVAGVNPGGDQALRVLLLCAQNRVEEARDLTLDGWPTLPRDWSWLTYTCLQGAAQAAVGDIRACAATYSALLPYSGRISVGAAIAFLGPVDWFLASLASAIGDRDAAVRHLATLARLAGEAGLPAWRDRAMNPDPSSPGWHRPLSQAR